MSIPVHVLIAIFMSSAVKHPFVFAYFQLQKMWVWSLSPEGPLEKEMATHSSILGWEILWTEEPGGLQPMESQSWTRISS